MTSKLRLMLFGRAQRAYAAGYEQGRFDASMDGLDADRPTARRGDVVAAWLKKCRDEYTDLSDEWHAINGLLDEYRDHADTGVPLLAEIKGPNEEAK